MAFAIHPNALIALAAAASWGGGDFSGGMGVKAAGGRTAGALRVIIVAHGTSLAVLLAILWLQQGAALPHGALLAWGLLSGVAGAFSLIAFYIALSRGAMGASAAVSGLLAAAIPAVVSSVVEGAPTALRLAGFVVAAAAIWMIAESSPENVDRAKQRGTMALAIAGGFGFGLYFVALRMDNPLGVLEPLALTRVASVVTCVLLLWIVGLRGEKLGVQPMSQKRDPSTGSGQAVRQPELSPAPWLGKTAMVWALGVAVLDTGGNLFYVAATRMGRMDVAAVLASLYPAGTILLAAWRLHERPTRRQFAGMAVALAAVLMITL